MVKKATKKNRDCLTNKTKIVKCPCCGRTPTMNPSGYIISCPYGCTTVYGHSEEEAISIWNTPRFSQASHD